MSWLKDFVKNSHARKRPGADGISSRDLKQLEGMKKLEFLYLANSVVWLKYFSNYWSLTTIVFIRKWDQDPTKLINRKPNSLLNTFANIIVFYEG